MRAALVAEATFGEHAEVGECPVWDEMRGDLLWVDVLAGLIHRRNIEAGRTSTLSVGCPVGSVVLTQSGDILAAARDGFRLVTPDGRSRMLAEVEPDDPATRLNDGHCDPQGRFWAGTMEMAASPGRGSLYRLDGDLSVRRMVEQVSGSNGIGWDPAGTVMYYIDTPTGRIDAFDFDPAAGAVSGRRPFAAVGLDNGVPDGLCVDSLGFVWVAFWGGGQVRRYSPAGDPDGVVELPVRYPTSCTFGGPNLDVLFITTASIASDAGDLARGAGDVFACRPGVSGMITTRFAGW